MLGSLAYDLSVLGRTGGMAALYAAYQAHILTRAPTSMLWSDSTPGSGAATRRISVGAPAGGMSGSSWIAYYADGDNVSRAVQHGLPSLATLTALSGSEILYRQSSAGAQTLNALDRNGYLSFAGSTSFGIQLDELVWFDPALGPMTNSPVAGSAAIPYTW